MVWIRMCLITFFGQLVELAANTELCQVASFSSSMEDACWLFICQTLKGQETGMHTKVQFLLIQLISSVCVCKFWNHRDPFGLFCFGFCFGFYSRGTIHVL